MITLSANSLLCNASSVSCVNNSLWMFDNKFVVLLWNACKFETFDLRAWHTDVFEVPKSASLNRMTLLVRGAPMFEGLERTTSTPNRLPQFSRLTTSFNAFDVRADVGACIATRQIRQIVSKLIFQHAFDVSHSHFARRLVEALKP